MKKTFLTFSAIVAIAIGLVSCGETTKETTSSLADSTTISGDTSVTSSSNESPSGKTIVQNLATTPDFASLAAAITSAGLTETLGAAGPYTVFAPANAAFDAIPKTSLDDLMKPENKEKLSGTLTYHVVPGNLKAADLKDGDKLKTVNGAELTVKLQDGKVWINDAEVTTADQPSSNGTVHTINKVLMP